MKLFVIFAVIFTAHLCANVFFTEEAISRRLTKRFRRKLERQRKERRSFQDAYLDKLSQTEI